MMCDSNKSNADEFYMQQALELAEKGLFTVQENPRVGCVLVKDNEIIATGFHARLGDLHAEASAIRNAGEHVRGCTAYITLEPCSHHGRNPPCADALIDAGVVKVVICNDDPNPLVKGGGYAALERANIEVVRHILTEQGQALNVGFLHRMSTGRPWVRLKQAQSLDGRTAMQNGDSVWITGKEARADVQVWRGRSGAIVTGIDTVLYDDCRLNVRKANLPELYQKIPSDFDKNQPFRVVLDSSLRLPLVAKVIGSDERCVVFTQSTDEKKIRQLNQLGVQVIQQGCQGEKINLQRVISWLGEQRINEVLFECGPSLASSLWSQELVDEWLLYTAPVVMGSSARPLLDINIEKMSNRHHIEIIGMTQHGKDWRLQAKPIYQD